MKDPNVNTARFILHFLGKLILTGLVSLIGWVLLVVAFFLIGKALLHDKRILFVYSLGSLILTTFLVLRLMFRYWPFLKQGDIKLTTTPCPPPRKLEIDIQNIRKMKRHRAVYQALCLAVTIVSSITAYYLYPNVERMFIVLISFMAIPVFPYIQWFLIRNSACCPDCGNKFTFLDFNLFLNAKRCHYCKAIDPRVL